MEIHRLASAMSDKSPLNVRSAHLMNFLQVMQETVKELEFKD
jgi:hypothetical protein